MKFVPIEPPRVFEIGRSATVCLRDCARIALAPDEQVTFVTEAGTRYDVARKAWGFYATPSLNGRLQAGGLRAVLVKSPAQKFYIWLLESGKEAAFEHYLQVEDHRVVCWLDSDAALTALEHTLQGR